MNIPVKFGVRGKVKATLTDTRDGSKREIKGNNLILDHYMDRAMDSGLGILGTQPFAGCHIGTGDTPPSPSDQGLKGTTLASSTSPVTTKDVALPEPLILAGSFENIEVGPIRCLAITPDEEILLVGSPNGVKAYQFDNENTTLSEIQVEDFNELSGIDCRHLATGGDYLFVGFNVAPWGKLFKRVGNRFDFIQDISEGNRVTTCSKISSDGSKLALLYSPSSYSPGKISVFDLQENSASIIVSWLDLIHSEGYSPLGIEFTSDNREILVTGRGLIVLSMVDGDVNVEYSVTHSGYGKGCLISDDEMVLVGGSPGSSASTCYLNRYVRGSDGLWTRVSVVDTGESSHGAATVHLWDNLFAVCYYTRVDAWALNKNMWWNKMRLMSSNGDNKNQSLVFLEGLNVLFTRNVEGNLSIYKRKFQYDESLSFARNWTFPAGRGTGAVREIALRGNSSSTLPHAGSTWVARIVLPEAIEKTDLHQLDVEWEIEVTNPGVWEGVIPGGSKDGTQDINWRFTLNEEQFSSLVTSGWNSLAAWFGGSGTPNLRVGDSSVESDLILDRENIYGDEIFYLQSTAIREVNPYVPGSLQRTFRVFLEVDQSNGEIGEMVLGGSQTGAYLGRITFDPPLEKDENYRLYIDVTFGWQRGE